eukprot:COSAG03_NODE_1521_length_3939_cov_8.358333_3_plen_188_part_00
MGFSDCALRFSTGIHPHFLIEKMGVLEAIWLRSSDTLESDCPAVCEAESVTTRQPCMHRRGPITTAPYICALTLTAPATTAEVTIRAIFHVISRLRRPSSTVPTSTSAPPRYAALPTLSHPTYSSPSPLNPPDNRTQPQAALFAYTQTSFLIPTLPSLRRPWLGDRVETLRPRLKRGPTANSPPERA